MDTYFPINAILSKFCKNYMELKRGLPIRPSEMAVLNIVTELEGPHTPVLLAELLGVSKPMMTAHITSLAGKGYITKSPSAQDKRAYYIFPTEKALELVETVRLDMSRQLDALMHGMGQENFEAFVQLVCEANRVLEEKKPETGACL